MREFYVARNGKDDNPGTKEAPFLSVEAARDAVRRLVERGLTEAVTVYVGEGEYPTEGLVFTGRDSGTPDCRITYQAQGTVILDGAVRLPGEAFTGLTPEERERLPEEAADQVVRIDLTRLGLTAKDWGNLCAIGSHNTVDRYEDEIEDGYYSPMWCELFFDDKRMELARYPDSGYLYSGVPVRIGESMENIRRKIPLGEWEKMLNPLSDIYEIDRETARRSLRWKTLEDVWMYGFPANGWADMSSPVVRLDGENCQMETRYVSMFGMRPNAPYYLFNIFEELDAPGEWYLDRKKGVLYLYPPREPAGAQITLSISRNSILKFENASCLTFRGFTLRGTRGNAVGGKGREIAIEDCVIKNVGQNGIVLEGEECRIRGCEIFCTGQGGIVIDGGDRAVLKPSGNLVTGNHIHHVGEIFKTYKPGVRIHGVGCVCSHNKIHDLAHAAIIFAGNEHVMEYNEIYRTCLFSDDAGAIYAGRDYACCGNVVRCNYFHHMESGAAEKQGIFGVYCDDNLGSCTIEKNVFINCSRVLHLHGGHDIIFRNNLILGGREDKPAASFSRFWFWKDLLAEGRHAQDLAKVPWQSGIWSDRYPHIAEYLSWDPETEQCFPHYCRLEDNVFLNRKGFDVNFAWDTPGYENSMKGNVELSGIPWIADVLFNG